MPDKLVYREAATASAVANRAVATGKAASLAATGVYASGIVVAALIGPPMLAAAGVVLPLLALPTPFGTAVSALTLWTGRWVSSCPHCPSFDVRRFEPDVAECEACGAHVVRADPVAAGRLVTKHTADGEETYCSAGCSP